MSTHPLPRNPLSNLAEYLPKHYSNTQKLNSDSYLAAKCVKPNNIDSKNQKISICQVNCQNTEDTNPTNDQKPQIDTFIFDIDSTVFDTELLDEFALFCNVDVSSITNRAMCGQISFAQALIDRIEIIGLNPDLYWITIVAFIQQMRKKVKFTKNFLPLLEKLYSSGYNVYFISGGFKIFIIDLLRYLLPNELWEKIDPDIHIYANHFTLPAISDSHSSTTTSPNATTTITQSIAHINGILPVTGGLERLGGLDPNNFVIPTLSEGYQQISDQNNQNNQHIDTLVHKDAIIQLIIDANNFKLAKADDMISSHDPIDSTPLNETHHSSSSSSLSSNLHTISSKSIVHCSEAAKIVPHITPKDMVSVDTSLFTAQTNGKARVLEVLMAEPPVRYEEKTDNTMDSRSQFGDNQSEGNSSKNIEQLPSSKLTKPVKNIIMIGDGVTDLQTKPPAIGVIGYGGVITRDIVLKKADWFIWDYNDLIELL